MLGNVRFVAAWWVMPAIFASHQAIAQTCNLDIRVSDCPTATPTSCGFVDIQVVYSMQTDPNVAILTADVVDCANAALMNSGVSWRYRIVDQRMVALDEVDRTDPNNPNSDRLSCRIMKNFCPSVAGPCSEPWPNSTGWVEQVKTARAEVQADIVCIVTTTAGGSKSCGGRGPVPRRSGAPLPRPGKAFFTISRTKLDCAQSFLHELGHASGISHEDGFCNQEPGSEFRTLINPAAQGTCFGRFILHYSNPDVDYCRPNDPNNCDPTGDAALVPPRNAAGILEENTCILQGLSYFDCNGNGTDDRNETLVCRAAAIGEAPPGEVEDFTVGLDDLIAQLTAFGSSCCDAAYNRCADLDDDGVIGLTDQALLLSVFGRQCLTQPP